jgi:hypothetical protein
MGHLTLYYYLQSPISLFKLPYGIVNFTVNRLVLVIVDWSIDKNKAIFIPLYLLSSVYIAYLALIFKDMLLIKYFYMTLSIKAEGSTLF